MNKKDLDYIKRLERQDEEALQELYFSFSISFMKFFRKYGFTKPEREDLFHDSLIAMYQNIIQKKFTNMDVGIKAYLWGIGKHKAIDLLRKKKIRSAEILKSEDGIEEQNGVLTDRQKLLHQYFSALQPSCKKVLKLFYYEGLTINEIVSLGNYKDANSVKSTKSRCIKNLRELINKGRHG
ncbi:RNA polymerase sigma factor [Portibacter marinus]|uniref:RNA polymerase sigma factor n=1 Tax=Portibacter marinus TaxID=2898660 RepID=UPI001F26F419|nr:sigma-70 family RNA polymerase sigma factor [Portibacter marinus]